MKLYKGDIIKSEADLIVYLSNGSVARNFKNKQPATYNWVFPRRPLPIGSIMICGKHVIFFAEDEYGGIRAGDMYECFKELKHYINEMGIDEENVAITEELYRIITKRDYINE